MNLRRNTSFLQANPTRGVGFYSITTSQSMTSKGKSCSQPTNITTKMLPKQPVDSSMLKSSPFALHSAYLRLGFRLFSAPFGLRMIDRQFGSSNALNWRLCRDARRTLSRAFRFQRFGESCMARMERPHRRSAKRRCLNTGLANPCSAASRSALQVREASSTNRTAPLHFPAGRRGTW